MRTAKLVLALFPFITASPAVAITIPDPVGDFLPSFVGTHSPDLDVTSFSVTFDGTNFLIGATLAGPVLPATNGLYVVGVNTGTGVNAPFGNIGEPNVTFNQVLLVNGATGVGTVGATPVTLWIFGNAFSAIVPLALLPSTGAAPTGYGFNLWPRVGLGNNNQISDFAPENRLLSVNGLLAPVPEPATWLSMLLGFAMIGGAMRFRRAKGEGRLEQIA